MLSEGCQDTHLEVYSAISPAGEIYYQLHNSNYMSSEVLRFRQDLLFYFSPPWLIIGDGASIHGSKEVKEWLRTENLDGRVPLARLPAYRPQLNAAEPVWAWFKGGQLKTVCCKKRLTGSLKPSRKHFTALTANPAIIQKCFDHPEVAFY